LTSLIFSPKTFFSFLSTDFSSFSLSSCIVADEHDPTAQMQEIMRSMGQADMPQVKPILEVNPAHIIVKKLKDMTKKKAFDDIALLLFEQALIQEGVKLEDPAGFVDRLNKVIAGTL
jgi:molecular chaperone HtpG